MKQGVPTNHKYKWIENSKPYPGKIVLAKDEKGGLWLAMYQNTYSFWRGKVSGQIFTNMLAKHRWPIREKIVAWSYIEIDHFDKFNTAAKDDLTHKGPQGERLQ